MFVFGNFRYLEWQVVEGTFVYQYQKAGYFSSEKFIHKVNICCRLPAANCGSMLQVLRLPFLLLLVRA